MSKLLLLLLLVPSIVYGQVFLTGPVAPKNDAFQYMIDGDMVDCSVEVIEDACLITMITAHSATDDAHQALVTITGQDYLTLSTQQITMGEIEPDDLASSDFGEFTCNGTTCTIDSSIIDADNIGTNAVQADELDVSDVSDNIAADIAEGELANSIVISADIKDDDITYADIADASQNDTKCIGIETPSDDDNFLMFYANQALTITSIDCIVEDATSVVIIIQECEIDGDTCAGVDGVTAITCDVDGEDDDGSLSNASIDATDWVRIDIGTVTDTPGHVTACISFTWDD